MEVWPVPRKNCHPNSCPFDTPRSYRTSKTFSKSRRTRRGRHSDRSVKKSPGFCDCCEHSYNDWTRVLSLSHIFSNTNCEHNIQCLGGLLVKAKQYSHIYWINDQIYCNHKIVRCLAKSAGVVLLKL